MISEFHDLLVAELPRMRGYARVLTRDRTLADDLLQEAVLKAWRGQHQFTPGSNFKGWLYCILRNEFIGLCRKSRQAPISIDLLPPEIFGYKSDQEEAIVTRQVMQAMDRLPTDQREVMFLKCVSELSYEEIAASSQCSLGTVKSRLWRARAAMRKQIDSGDEGDASVNTRPANDQSMNDRTANSRAGRSNVAAVTSTVVPHS